MGYVRYYRNSGYPFFMVKKCIGQSHASRKHFHNQLAISFVTGGSSLFRFGEDEYHIHAGQLVLIAPGFVHQCLPDEVEAWSFQMIFVEESWLESNGITGEARPCFVVKDLTAAEFRVLESHFQALCKTDGFCEEALFSIVDMAMSENESSIMNLQASDLANEGILRASAYIRGHLAEAVRLDDLAEVAGMNKFMLIRCFAKAYNTTPHAWQNMLRMDEARRLLEAGNTIADAALAAGFYDQSHFSRSFKESFGITPKQFTSAEKIGLAY